MCMVCVDEAAMGVAIVIASMPWWKVLWTKLFHRK
jgi:hypothetical protein